jgi:ligand-binding SRPBCC domain-containing protein
MDYHHRFIVDAPLEKVQNFHRSAGSLKAITPPVFFMRDLNAPDTLSEGSRVSFTLHLGPFPIRWGARVENLGSSGFDDVQTSGPFRQWIHTHRFQSLSDDASVVLDHVHLRLKSHPLWGPIGALMVFGLTLLFAYRAHKTKSLLERSST